MRRARHPLLASIGARRAIAALTGSRAAALTPGCPMSIKLRILLLQIVVGLAVVVMAGVALAATRAMTASLERVRWSNQQLDAATQLQVLANRYSEQVAELLLVGASERVDFDDARDRMAAWFREPRR